MQTFSVTYSRTDGRVIETEVEAEDESEVYDILFEEDYYFLDIVFCH